MTASFHDPLTVLLHNTESRYWQVPLQPRSDSKRTGLRFALPVGWSQGQIIHPQDEVGLHNCLLPLLAGKDLQVSCEYRARQEQNEWRWFRLRAHLEEAKPSTDFPAAGPTTQIVFWASEITRQKRSEQLLALQSRIVQQLASGADLSIVLAELATGVEANYVGASVSLLGVAPDGKTLRHLAAPSLPKHISAKIDGLPIGPTVGSCGSAAATGQRVVIPDVNLDSRMTGFESLARETGIRSVWSQPIIGAQGEVLGTLAIYRLQVHSPSEDEIELIVMAANLAALAIENCRRIERLLHSEARFRELAEKARLVPWEAQLGEDRYTYVGPQAEEIFGYPIEDWHVPGFWYRLVHPDDRERCLQVFYQHLVAGEHFENEYRVPTKNGDIVWVHDYITIFRRDGKPVRLRGYMVDVTERKKAETAQRESDALLDAVMKSLPFRLWAADCDGKVVLQNPVSLAQFGNVCGTRVADMKLPPHIAAQHDSFVQRALRGEVVHAEIAHDFLKKPTVDQCLIAPIHLGEAIIGVLGCDIDVTEQRRVEDLLRKSESQLRTLMQSAPDIILQTKRDMTIVYCNRVLPPLALDQVIGTNCLQWVDLDYHHVVEAAFEQVFGSGQSCSYETISSKEPAGKRWWSVQLAPVIDNGQIDSAIMMLRDITRRKEMQQQLQDRDERFSQLAEATDQGFWLVDLNPERLLYVNPAFARIWGLPEEEFYTGRRVGESFIVPEDFNRVHTAFDEWLVGKRKSYNVEYRIVRPDGQLRWVHDHGAKIFDAHGVLVRISGIVRDVTDQKRAEVILRESEERYRLLAENSSDLIMRVDNDGNCVYASPASRLLLGLDPQDIKTGYIFSELVHPDDASRLFAVREAFRETGKPLSLTARFKHASGEYRTLDVQAKAVVHSTTELDAAGNPLPEKKAGEILITARDATDRVVAAKKLRQREVDIAHADRMSTMGQMAAELAHELNQPLYAIANFATVSVDALTKAGDNPTAAISKAQHWLEEISRQSRRAADVIRRINAFARKGELDPSTFDISECVRTLESLLDVASRGHEATIRYELVEPLPPITADRLLIEQVIVNLVRNAAEAMEEVPQGERHIVVRTYPEGKGVGLSVADTGPGLENDPEKVFEPYFTTKEAGTGMGLAICRSTIEAHQGKIHAEINTAPNAIGGHGALFRVWLPVGD